MPRRPSRPMELNRHGAHAHPDTRQVLATQRLPPECCRLPRSLTRSSLVAEALRSQLWCCACCVAVLPPPTRSRKTIKKIKRHLNGSVGHKKLDQAALKCEPAAPTATADANLLAVLLAAGCGCRLWLLAMAAGYGCWLWLLLAAAGCGCCGLARHPLFLPPIACRT